MIERGTRVRVTLQDEEGNPETVDGWVVVPPTPNFPAVWVMVPGAGEASVDRALVELEDVEVDCKFCGVLHTPGHNGCSGYPNI
jgi:hypothetical protein